MNICFEISDVDWALTKDVFGLIATVVSLVGVGVAIYFGFRGLSVWRKQLRGGADHSVAMEALVALYKFRNAVLAAREPVFLQGYDIAFGQDVSKSIEEQSAEYGVFCDAMKSRYDAALSEQARLEAATLACEAAWGDVIKSPLDRLNHLFSMLHGGGLKLIIRKAPQLSQEQKTKYIDLREGDENVVFSTSDDVSVRFADEFLQAWTELEGCLKSKLST